MTALQAISLVLLFGILIFWAFVNGMFFTVVCQLNNTDLFYQKWWLFLCNYQQKAIDYWAMAIFFLIPSIISICSWCRYKVLSARNKGSR